MSNLLSETKRAIHLEITIMSLGLHGEGVYPKRAQVEIWNDEDTSWLAERHKKRFQTKRTKKHQWLRLNHFIVTCYESLHFRVLDCPFLGPPKIVSFTNITDLKSFIFHLDTRFELEFPIEMQSVSGFSGCNTISSTYWGDIKCKARLVSSETLTPSPPPLLVPALVKQSWEGDTNEEQKKNSSVRQDLHKEKPHQLLVEAKPSSAVLLRSKTMPISKSAPIGTQFRQASQSSSSLTSLADSSSKPNTKNFANSTSLETKEQPEIGNPHFVAEPLFPMSTVPNSPLSTASHTHLSTAPNSVIPTNKLEAQNPLELVWQKHNLSTDVDTPTISKQTPLLLPPLESSNKSRYVRKSGQPSTSLISPGSTSVGAATQTPSAEVGTLQKALDTWSMSNLTCSLEATFSNLAQQEFENQIVSQLLQ